MKIRLHRSAQWLRRNGLSRATHPLVDCIDELRLIADHHRSIESPATAPFTA